MTAEQAQAELLNLKLNLPEDWIRSDSVAHWMDEETAAGFILHSMREEPQETKAAAVAAFMEAVNQITPEQAQKTYSEYLAQ